MEFVTWNQAYEVGIVDIDVEHRSLIATLNLLNESKEVEKKKIFISLLSKLKTHFSNEETVMRNLGCAELESHKKIHEDLRLDIQKYEENANHGKINFDKKFMVDFKKWMIDHIVEDTEDIQDCKGIVINTGSAV